MRSDGLLEDFEFEKIIETADPITRVLARESRQTRKEVASLRSEMTDSLQQLPCRQDQDCSPPKKFPRSLAVGLGGGGALAVAAAIYELARVLSSR